MADACENIAPLIRACRSLLFTIHRVQNPSLAMPLWKSAIRNNRRIMKTLRAYNLSRQNAAFGRLIDGLKAHQKEGHTTSVMVHTQRERDVLATYYKYKEAVDFPLTFLNKSQIASCLSDRAAIRKKVFERYSFDPSAKYIGIFGFLTRTKAITLRLILSIFA